MKKYLSLAILLCAVAFNGIAVQEVQAWGSATGDGQEYRQLQETAIFFNNSGTTLTQGDVVVTDVDGDNVSTGSTLGSYVTTVSQEFDGGHYGANSILVRGVVLSTSVANQRPVVVVTKGPALTTCDDSTSAVSEFTAVGTVSRANDNPHCGGGTNLGVSLEAGDGTDGDQLIIFVEPTGAD